MNNSATSQVQEKLATIPGALENAQTEWAIVHAAISHRAAKKRPKMLNYEVWHEVSVARDAFMDAILEGKSIEEAKFLALDRVKIGYVRNEAGRFLRWAE